MEPSVSPFRAIPAPRPGLPWARADGEFVMSAENAHGGSIVRPGPTKPRLKTHWFKITQRSISTVAASRTDAGVHALGQVVGFRSEKPLRPDEWTRALNGVLPKNISVRQTEVAADDFHARYDAHSKTYEYRILNQPTRPALDRLRVWQIAKPLDVNRMRSASRHALGRHDCTSLQGSPTSTKIQSARSNALTVSTTAR